MFRGRKVCTGHSLLQPALTVTIMGFICAAGHPSVGNSIRSKPSNALVVDLSLRAVGIKTVHY